ncbi:hypothetical protein DFJ74DRAFT_703538 [Hyaloraphidium curvatum]|nr:hypothetical protein DFJ74DRAFT_703538 [Hyaloraphidium curvatum]
MQAADNANGDRRGSAASSAGEPRRRSTYVGTPTSQYAPPWPQQPRRASTAPGRPQARRPPQEPEQHDDAAAAAGLLVTVPLVIAIVPPLLSALTGNSQIWGDLLMVLFVAYYLQYLMRVPWDLYEASRSARAAAPRPPAAADASSPAAQHALAAAAELRRLELFNLLLVVASPALGGAGLWFAKRYLLSPGGPIGSQFNIGLFVFAAGIRPAVHVAELVKNRAVALQKEAHMPYPEIDALRDRVGALEAEVAAVRGLLERGAAGAVEAEGVREALQGVEKLKGAVRKLREGTKDAEALAREAERVRELERRVAEQGDAIAALRGGEVELYREAERAERGAAGLALELGARLAAWSVELAFLPLTITLSVARAVGGRMLRGIPRKPMIAGE